MISFPALADEVVLKEGKVLTGTIVQEDADEIGIMLGEGMFLRVDRDNIRSVKRTSEIVVKEPVRSTVPIHSRSVLNERPKKKSVKPLVPADVVHLKKTAVGIVTIRQTIIEKQISFSGRKLEEAEEAVLSALSEQATDEARNKAFNITWNTTWEGGLLPSEIRRDGRISTLFPLVRFSFLSGNPARPPIAKMPMSGKKLHSS